MHAIDVHFDLTNRCALCMLSLMSEEIDLVSVRSALGMSRSDLAAETGVDVSTISRWETKGLPSRGSARALINRLAEQAARAASNSGAEVAA